MPDSQYTPIPEAPGGSEASEGDVSRLAEKVVTLEAERAKLSPKTSFNLQRGLVGGIPAGTFFLLGGVALLVLGFLRGGSIAPYLIGGLLLGVIGFLLYLLSCWSRWRAAERQRLSSLAAAIFACSACAPSIEITTSSEPTADFSALKSYAWASGSRLNLVDPSADNATLEGNIRAAVERELAAKGFTKTSSGSADFLVSFAGASNRSLRSQTVNRYYGYDPYFARPDTPASMPGGAGSRGLYQ